MATHDDSSVSEVNTVSEKSDVDLHTVSHAANTNSEWCSVGLLEERQWASHYTMYPWSFSTK